jgi:hypothetical protein
MTRIRLSRRKGFRLPRGAVVVSRPTKWGNPFKGRAAVSKYRRWLKGFPAGKAIAAAAKRELRGKQLACWCPLDRECHADVLIEIANGGSR